MAWWRALVSRGGAVCADVLAPLAEQVGVKVTGRLARMVGTGTGDARPDSSTSVRAGGFVRAVSASVLRGLPGRLASCV